MDNPLTLEGGPGSVPGQYLDRMQDIVGVASHTESFNTFVAAVKAADLEESLRDSGPFTLFLPTDGAFARMPRGAIDALLADKDKLRAVLMYHVVPGRLTSEEILQSGGGSSATVNGAVVHIAVRDRQLYVDGARVVGTDVLASNGIIHVIDAVIAPATSSPPQS